MNPDRINAAQAPSDSASRGASGTFLQGTNLRPSPRSTNPLAYALSIVLQTRHALRGQIRSRDRIRRERSSPERRGWPQPEPLCACVHSCSLQADLAGTVALDAANDSHACATIRA